MNARTLLPLIVLCLAVPQAAAQSRGNLERHGRVSVLELSSAELPEVLQMIRARIAASGIASKWGMPTDLLTQDAVIAEEITFVRGRRLVLAPRTLNERNIVFFIARTIKFDGLANQPLVIEWSKNVPGLVREPIRFAKGSNGFAGEREGADGKPGADGVQGNRGLRGPDTPVVVFVAQRFEGSGPIRFQLEGQDGGPGGPGQDGGDGGAGRLGRPSLPIESPIGVSLKREISCEPGIRSGSGGRGGNGGAGGFGAPGGDGGDVAFLAVEVNLDMVKRLVDPDSNLGGGKGGPRGPRGLGGRGGIGGPALGSPPPCESSPAGALGKPGEGRDPSVPPVADAGGSAPEGSPGTVVFSRLTPSQAAVIGLVPAEQR